MNILFVTPFFIEKKAGNAKGYKDISGMPMYIYRIAKALNNMGHNAVIVCGGTRNAREKFDGVQIYRVDTRVDLYIDNSLVEIFKQGILENFKLQKAVNRICRQNKVDIIQYAGNNGTGMFHYIDVPAVIRVSSYYKLFFSDYETYSKSEVLFHSYIEKLALKRVQHIYCPSYVLARYLKKEVGKHIDVIEPPFFDDAVERDYSIYNSKLKEKKYVLYYGVLSPRKGVLQIADMAKDLLDKYTNYYLVVIGKNCKARGTTTLELMKQRMGTVDKEKVIYMQELHHSCLYPIIENAEVVLIPSYMENLSNACMEAMAFGKIVVGTRGASFEQLIKDEINGFLAEVGDAESLYKCTCQALELTEDEKTRMGNLARKRIAQLKPEKKVDQLIKYYTKIIEGD